MRRFHCFLNEISDGDGAIGESCQTVAVGLNNLLMRGCTRSVAGKQVVPCGGIGPGERSDRRRAQTHGARSGRAVSITHHVGAEFVRRMRLAPRVGAGEGRVATFGTHARGIALYQEACSQVQV